MQTDIHISFEMIHQGGEQWVNYYELYWVKNTLGLWICVDDGRAINFHMANRIGNVVKSKILPYSVSPSDTIHRAREWGASFQHIYNCGIRGFKKVSL